MLKYNRRILLVKCRKASILHKCLQKMLFYGKIIDSELRKEKKKIKGGIQDGTNKAIIK